MGMLTAFLSGASRGLDVLGQGMLRDVERAREDDIWKKRQAVLAEIQRENARVAREDQAAFDDARFPVRMQQEGELTAARGKAQTQAEIDRLRNPDFVAAQDEATRQATQRAIDAAVQKANDPNLTEIQRREAKQKLDDLREEVRIRGDGAIRVANATRGPTAPTSDQRVAEYTKVMGAPPSKEVELQIRGFTSGKTDEDSIAKWARSLVTEEVKSGALPSEQAPAKLQQLIALMQPPQKPRTQEEASAQYLAAAAARPDLIPQLQARMRADGFSIPGEEDKSALKTTAQKSPREPIQLLQPLYDLNAIRKRMQQQTNE